MRNKIVGNYIKISLGIIIGGWIFAAMSHAESDIKLWKSQTVFVPIYSHIFLGGNERVSLNLSANLIIRNTDLANSIQIAEVIYYDTEGKLLQSYLNAPKELKPMASAYFLIETADTRGRWGANFIIKWESANKVTAPLVEAIHTGGRGTGAYIFASRGWVTVGRHE